MISPRYRSTLIHNNYKWKFLQSNRHLPWSPVLRNVKSISSSCSSNASKRIPHRMTGIGLGITIGIVSYSILDHTKNGQFFFNDTIKNTGSIFKNTGFISNKKQLMSDPDAETYEMGLFVSSERELSNEIELERNRRVHGPLGFIFRLKYWFCDYVLENIITVGRFVEISLIFLPIFAIYPISWFGGRDVKNNKARYGSVLWYRLLRHGIEMAGLSFIKLGQWAASRTDIFPNQMCKELSNLHSNAKQHSLKLTRKIICKTFGVDNFDKIFAEFDPVPLGVGAIAQVYKLKFLSNEEKTPQGWVAIKVVHPGVEIKIERDLRIMRFFAALINIIPTMEWLSLPQEVEQFSLLMKLQLDLRIEGLNLMRFQENFKDKEDIKFPTPYMDLSGREVLVEEFISGVSISKFLKLSGENDKSQLLKEISDKVLDSFLQMLILDNFIHADLHPGNIMVKFHRKDKKRKKSISTDDEMTEIVTKLDSIDAEDYLEFNLELLKLHQEEYHAEICYIDAGLVTELNEVDRVNFIELFNALSEFDGYRAGELMIQRSRTPETVVDNELFALKVEKLVDRMKQRTFTLGNLSIGDLLDQVLGMVRNHHVRMEGDFITVVVAILLLEGIGRQLDPNLDLFASALPVLRQLGLQDGRYLLQDGDALSMIKVWMALEIRQFIHVSIQDIHNLVKSDGLCPNY